MRFKSLIVTVFVSFALLVALICLIWWNEQVAYKSKSQSRRIYNGTINVDINNINADNDGHLVYLNGDLSYEKDTAGDYVFDVYVDSPRINRIVEKYQYRENTSKDENGNTQYTYDKVWSSTYINSKKFNNSTIVNPTENRYLSESFYADNIRIGKYKLSDSLKSQIEVSEAYTNLDPIIAEAYDLRMDDKYYYTSADPANPQIGDLRISFVYSPVNKGSILSMQSYDSFIAYTANSGITYNRFIGRIVNKGYMIQLISSDSDLLRWELRLSLMVMLFFLMLVTFRPVTKYTERIKFFGRIDLSYLIILCVLFTITVYSLEAALVWLIYSPIVSLVLLLIALVSLAIVYFTGRRNEINTRETQMFNYTPEVVEGVSSSDELTWNQKEEQVIDEVLNNNK